MIPGVGGSSPLDHPILNKDFNNLRSYEKSWLGFFEGIWLGFSNQILCVLGVSEDLAVKITEKHTKSDKKNGIVNLNEWKLAQELAEIDRLLNGATTTTQEMLETFGNDDYSGQIQILLEAPSRKKN